MLPVMGEGGGVFSYPKTQQRKKTNSLNLEEYPHDIKFSGGRMELKEVEFLYKIK